MRAAKVIGLGILFSFIVFIMVIVISIMSGRATFETSHATGFSSMVGGVIEAFLNPITWLVVVVAFVAATWVTRKTSKRTSTF